MSEEMLKIYINDHLALLVAETELADRCERSNSQGELGLLLRQLAADLRVERDVVKELLECVGGSVSRIKEGMGWLTEKAGRFKLNDRLLQYSDLSRLIELETLWIAAHERQSFWEIVQATHAADPRLEQIDFANRRAQAERHCDLLATLRLEAARKAFSSHSAG